MTQKLREIALDTETTGFSFSKNGDRMVEVGCVELLNMVPTGREFHAYINPERDVPFEAEKVHGLSTEFLKDKPVFKDIAKALLDFIGTSRLVIHNAQFDMAFLNGEFQKAGFPQLGNPIADTLIIARKQFPNKGSHTLDAMLNHYKINKDSRADGHGAIIDAKLLAQVWLELNGGANYSMSLPAATPGKRRSLLARRRSPVVAGAGNQPDQTKSEKDQRPAPTAKSSELRSKLVVVKPSETEVCDNRAFREANGFPPRG
ncbi:DNA polymerase III subunit epsilon [Salipiger sp. PrR003]|uniref:DNA polymerase III subunit epsilon n=1 Tax=Salipiger sp. PrR003 TaxID=2706776 RepID=UPI0013D96D59|nr:DNA polymerase III subunit epsilon [Salipiger sp. PrR003]NDV52895.1 DNA polymerase III subunit epsilon [Salipiger sp. PrR003]